MPTTDHLPEGTEITKGGKTWVGTGPRSELSILTAAAEALEKAIPLLDDPDTWIHADDTYMTSLLRIGGVTIRIDEGTHEEVIEELRLIALTLPKHALAVRLSKTGRTLWVDPFAEDLSHLGHNERINAETGMSLFRKWMGIDPNLCRILPNR